MTYASNVGLTPILNTICPDAYTVSLLFLMVIKAMQKCLLRLHLKVYTTHRNFLSLKEETGARHNLKSSSMLPLFVTPNFCYSRRLTASQSWNLSMFSLSCFHIPLQKTQPQTTEGPFAPLGSAGKTGIQTLFPGQFPFLLFLQRV